MMESALYTGKLRHRRFTPKEHQFTYPIFMAFLDVDRLAELMGASRIASYNRFNWISYFEKDHFGDRKRPLRERLATDAAAAGVSLPDGPIFLLTHLRYAGYVFNPVSFFYFYDRNESLRMMMAEVNNTFGESYNYWLFADREEQSAAARRYRTKKHMHVSPFMEMNLEYDWIFTPPGRELVAHMNTREGGKPFFDATLEMERKPWNGRELRKVALAYPLMTLRVIGAIHWEALQLWWKQVPVFTHPAKAAAELAGRPATRNSSEENLP
jgi:DUF1365 family protein